MNSLGVITVTYNSGAVIDEFLVSLFAQVDVNWHLYVVDSSSQDDTCNKIIAYNFEKITLIQQNENVGFAKGNNIGISRAIFDGCNELLLINNDTAFDKGFLTKLLKNRDIISFEILKKMDGHFICGFNNLISKLPFKNITN